MHSIHNRLSNKHRFLQSFSENMEEITLPNINQMYHFIKNNKDYVNPIRRYEGTSRDKIKKPGHSKRTHYLDECIKLSCSPGPANKANMQEEWARNGKIQCKRSEKTTYLDVLTSREKKLNFPSPNKYIIQQPWPTKIDKAKVASDKSNFVSTAQYVSDKLPGPGTYNLINNVKPPKKEQLKSPHKPIKEKEEKSADMATYSPCPLEYNTFQRMKKHISHPTLAVKLQSIKHAKQNALPGPATYSVINNWEGKQKRKKNDFSLKNLSFARPLCVYYS